MMEQTFSRELLHVKWVKNDPSVSGFEFSNVGSNYYYVEC